MRIFYCIKCCQKTRAKDNVFLLICPTINCGNKLVENGVEGPVSKELFPPKPSKKLEPARNMFDCTDKALFFQNKYKKVVD